MRNTKKKLLSGLLAISVLTGFFTGCTNKGNDKAIQNIRDSLVMAVNSQIQLTVRTDVKISADKNFLQVEDGKIQAVKAGETTAKVSLGRAKKEVKVKIVESVDVQPYSINYTFYNEEATAYGFTWNTDTEGCPVIQYCKEGESFETCQTVNVYESYNANEENYICKGVVEGLDFNSVYHFRIGDLSGVWSEQGTIYTRQENVKDFNFTVVTDTQNVNNEYSYFEKTLKKALDSNPDSQFILHTGDFVEYSKKEYWSAMFESVNSYLKEYPIIPVGGNHDTLEGFTDGKLYPFTKYFNIEPVNNQNMFRGQYYTFTYGEVRFIVLDCYETSKAMSVEQQQWLESILKNNDKKWTIVSAHCPVFSPAEMALAPQYRTPTVNLRKQLLQLTGKYKIDLVLSGDDHIFSRSYPINEKKEIVDKDKCVEVIMDGMSIPIYKNISGTIYQVNGITGNKYGNLYENVTEEDLSYIETYHIAQNPTYLSVNVSSKQLIVKLYEVNINTEEQVLIDAYGIEKQ